MTTREFCILESGFSIPPNEILKTRSQQSSEDAFDKFILNKPYLDTKSVAFFHAGIDAVYKEFRENEHKVNNFDFRERVLKEVFNIFRKFTLVDFLEYQKSNPRITATHFEFMLDTFKYLLQGRRSVSIDNWNTVIGISTTKHTNFIKNSELDIVIRDLGKVLTNNVDTFRLWTTNYNDGFYDMVVFMGIVFGSHNAVGNINS